MDSRDENMGGLFEVINNKMESVIIIVEYWKRRVKIKWND